VHRDFHVEVGKALYSVPKEYQGAYLDARADAGLVKLFHQGRLVKVAPRQAPGGRWTDPGDLPAQKAGYAMRDVETLVKTAYRHGNSIGIYAQRVLEDPLPWTKMRQVYRLLGLVRRYGPGPVETACSRALDLDVVAVSKISSMLEKATENTPMPPPRPVAAAGARFARDPAEFATGYSMRGGVQLSLVRGGDDTATGTGTGIARGDGGKAG
jgi:hypothetical protein